MVYQFTCIAQTLQPGNEPIINVQFNSQDGQMLHLRLTPQAAAQFKLGTVYEATLKGKE